MSSVTERIKEIKQPRGGYVKVSEFDAIALSDGKELNGEENVHASVIGMAVDYLTRFMMGTDIQEAFKISIMGATFAEKIAKRNGSIQELNKYLSEIKGLDQKSIENACKAVTFDVWLRNPFAAELAKTAKETNADPETIENIKILVERSLNFWKEYGPIKSDGFTFEGGYTDTIDSGDGDFLTEDTLWDFKVSKAEPKSNHTLQLLVYYIMGIHSGKAEFKNIKKVGIYNPRLNKVYLYEISKLSKELIEEIEKNVIGY